MPRDYIFRARLRALLVPLMVLGRIGTASGDTGAEVPVGLDTVPVISEAPDGRRFYEQGIGVSGLVVRAYIGEGSTPVPASAVTCTFCHGPDGRGRPEGGLNPPDIRWATLSKPYGHTHRDQGGREHPAFDEESLFRALADGTDPAGNPLAPAMPRYVVSREDIAALADYLRALDNPRERGITPDRVTMGTVVPADGPAAEAGLVLRSLMTALMDDINGAGGIHGRQMHLVTIEAGTNPEATARTVRAMIRERRLFALIAPFAPGAETELARVAGEEGTPVIAPFEPFPVDGRSRGDVFHVFPTRSRQMALLVRHARKGRMDQGGTLILHDGHAATGALADGLAEASVSDVTSRLYDGSRTIIDSLAAEVGGKRYTRILYLAAAGNFPPLVTALAPQRADIDLLLPGWSTRLAPVAARTGWPRRILIGLPMDAGGLPPDTRRRIRQVSDPLGFGGRHMTMQIMAYAAVKLASEGLRRAGRAVRVETFRAALEGLDDYDGGIGLPLSYSRNRRHGLDGIRVIEVTPANGRTKPTATWVTWN